MPITSHRTVRSYRIDAAEVLEVVWKLADGTTYAQRFTAPPLEVVRAERAKRGEGVDPEADVPMPEDSPRVEVVDMGKAPAPSAPALEPGSDADVSDQQPAPPPE